MLLPDYLKSRSDLTNAWLERLLPSEIEEPAVVHQAMRYSVFAGGKRVRPILCIAAGELFDAAADEVMPVACALEMIHTYSLVHDDLPAMDDDDLRRGRPTCHKAFGEAIAILAGDALLTRAFEVLVDPNADPSRRMRIIGEVARASGSVGGMIGGQVLDIQAEGKSLGADQLTRVHRAKTGALLTASCVVGAISGGATESEVATLRAFGASTGLAFQISDDILDVTATREELGKTPGKDSTAHKATYVSLYGLEQSRRMAEDCVKEAETALDSLGRTADRLREIARFIVERRS